MPKSSTPTPTPAQERAARVAETGYAANNKRTADPRQNVPDAAVPRPIIVRPPAGGR